MSKNDHSKQNILNEDSSRIQFYNNQESINNHQKSHIKSGFTSSAHQTYLLSAQKPKEIEDLFEEGTRNFYKNSNQLDNITNTNGGRTQNQTDASLNTLVTFTQGHMYDRSVHLSASKNGRASNHFRNNQQFLAQSSDRSKLFNQPKASISLSIKKQAPSGKVDRKLAVDDDNTQAYNTRITHNEQQQNQYQNLRDQLRISSDIGKLKLMNRGEELNDTSIDFHSSSSLSDSPKIESSLQKHAKENQKSCKVLNPFSSVTSKTQNGKNSNQQLQRGPDGMWDYSTIQSAVSSVQVKHTPNQQIVGCRNANQSISQSLNQRALSGLSKAVNQANMAVKELKINLSETKRSKNKEPVCIQQQKNVQDEQRLKQSNSLFPQKSQQPSKQSNMVPKPQQNNQIQQKLNQGIQTASTSRKNNVDVKQIQIVTLGNSSMRNIQHNYTNSVSGRGSKISICLLPKSTICSQTSNLNHSQVPKVQDKPQAKKITDDSDQETIDSQDMSSIIQDLRTLDKQTSQAKFSKKNLSNKMLNIPQTLQSFDKRDELLNNNLQSQGSLNKEMFSFNEGLITGQSNQASIAQINQVEIKASSQNNAAFKLPLTKNSISPIDPLSLIQGLQNIANGATSMRSTSSARKRARWDLSGGKSTLQNSFRKNSDTDSQHYRKNNNNQNLLKVNKTAQQEKGSVSESQSQYEMLQQQYLAIKEQLKQFKQLQNQPQKLLTEDEKNYLDILSPDQQNSTYSQDADEESIDNLHRQTKDQKKTYHHTTAKQMKKNRVGNHFKSLDIQMNPHIIRTTNKQMHSPISSINNYQSNDQKQKLETDQKQCKYEEQEHQAMIKLKRKLADEIQNFDRFKQTHDLIIENDQISNYEPLQNKINQKHSMSTKQTSKSNSNVLKSQLQIGLRKLSDYRQIQEIGIGVQSQVKIQKNSQTNYKKQRDDKDNEIIQSNRIIEDNTSREYYRKKILNVGGKKNKRTVSNSQVSFVGVDSESSDEFKDCKSQIDSIQTTHVKSKSHKSISKNHKRQQSNVSSQYEIANDKSQGRKEMYKDELDSDCSCCRAEMKQKSQKKKYGGWIDSKNDDQSEFILKQSSRVKEKKKNKESKTYDLSRQEISRLDQKQQANKTKQSQIIIERESLEHREKSKTHRNSSRADHKNQKQSTNKNKVDYGDDRDHEVNILGSNKKRRSTSRQQKSQTNQKNKKNTTEQTPKQQASRQKQSKNLSQSSINLMNPWLQGNNNYGYEAASLNLLQQQLAFAQQLQAPHLMQSPMLQPMLNQSQAAYMGMPQLLNNQISNLNQNSSIIGSMPISKLHSPLSYQAQNNLEISRALNSQAQPHSIINQKQQISQFNNSSQANKQVGGNLNNYTYIEPFKVKTTIEEHQEQINAIESLIQQAKNKLQDNIFSNQNQNCRVGQNQSGQQQYNNINKSRSAINSNRDNHRDQQHHMNNQNNYQDQYQNDLQDEIESKNQDMSRYMNNHLNQYNKSNNMLTSSSHRPQNDHSRNQIDGNLKSHHNSTYNSQRHYSQQNYNMLDSSSNQNNLLFKTHNSLTSNHKNREGAINCYDQERYSHFEEEDNFQERVLSSRVKNKIKRELRGLNLEEEQEDFEVIKLNPKQQKNQQAGRELKDIDNRIKDKFQSKEEEEEQQINAKGTQRNKNFDKNSKGEVKQNKDIFQERSKQSNEQSNQNPKNKEKITQNTQQTTDKLLWIDFDEESTKTSINKKQQLKSKRLQNQSKPQQDQESDQDFSEALISSSSRYDNIKMNLINSKHQARRGHVILEKSQDDEDFQIESSQQQPSQKYQSKQKEAWVMDFTDKPMSPEQKQQAQSMAEAFKNRMQSMEQRFKKSIKDENKDQQESGLQYSKREFTKEELLERKKELLKSAREKLQKNQQIKQTHQDSSQANDSSTITKMQQNSSRSNNVNNNSSTQSPSVPVQLLTRLSQGQKHEINKKDMLKLTSKNYEQLPEIKEKLKQNNKKEELLKRLQNAKQLDQKRREVIVKKQQLQQQQQQRQGSLLKNDSSKNKE